MSTRRGHARVLFNEGAFAEDIMRSGRAGAKVLREARAQFEREGVEISTLRRCDPEGRDGTKLHRCLFRRHSRRARNLRRTTSSYGSRGCRKPLDHQRSESTRLIWPAPIPRVAPSLAITIALGGGRKASRLAAMRGYSGRSTAGQLNITFDSYNVGVIISA